jgi:K+-transporting ATPase KdpF subunit
MPWSGFATSCKGRAMTLTALILSVAAFAYLVYAMLRPEKF